MHRSVRWVGLAFTLVLTTASCSSESPTADDGDPCTEPDQDGIIGGDYAFEVTVSDTELAPVILKAQNSSTVTLTLKNIGTRPHGFAIECLAEGGCLACFPETAKIDPIDPGTSKTTSFTAPEKEGIFRVISGAPGDTFTAQFILQ